jgi:hypothetical protein
MVCSPRRGKTSGADGSDTDSISSKNIASSGSGGSGDGGGLCSLAGVVGSSTGLFSAVAETTLQFTAKLLGGPFAGGSSSNINSATGNHGTMLITNGGAGCSCGGSADGTNGAGGIPAAVDSRRNGLSEELNLKHRKNFMAWKLVKKGEITDQQYHKFLENDRKIEHIHEI